MNGSNNGKPGVASASQPVPPQSGCSSQADAGEQPSNPLGISAVSSRRLAAAAPPATAGPSSRSGPLPPIRRTPSATPGEPSSAEGWREHGNALFKQGDWAAAREAYSRLALAALASHEVQSCSIKRVSLSGFSAILIS